MQVYNVVLSDDGYRSLAGKHKEIGLEIQTEIDTFIQTMLAMVEFEYSETVEESTMAGETARVVSEFGRKMKEYLSSENGNLQQILNDLAANSHSFVDAIKKADVYPFAPGVPTFSNA